MRKVWLWALILAIGAGLAFLWVNRPETPATEEQKQLWTCGMHPQVIQDKPGNCPICGMKLTPIRPQTERKIKYWWDPMMNPPYISDRPGKSPMGMDLIPVYEEMTGGIVIDPTVVQNMGIRTSLVTSGPLHTTIRAVGYFREAEPLQHDLNLKVGGWIEKLYADTEGMFVHKGEPLFELYSPELLVAEEELLSSTRSIPELVMSARRKLELSGVADEDVEAILKEGEARRALPIRSPIDGHVMEKTIVQGSAVQAGMKVLRIVDHSALWLDAQIFEYQLPLVTLGQKAAATVRGRGTFEGQVIFLHPHVDPITRTVAARLSFANPEFKLRPGMYATVELDVPVSDRAITVPREAVIDTGKRQISFVALEGGRFEPREVQMGVETPDGVVQILKGLAPGETVVTSGQFLLDSESRMREAIQKMLKPQQPVPRGKSLSDSMINAYLDAARMLATDRPVDPQALIQAADGDAREAAQAMTGASLEEQRKQFKRLSDAVIKRVEESPPSRKLYVIRCSMYPGSWLQEDREIRNPYYGRSMLHCGEFQ